MVVRGKLRGVRPANRPSDATCGAIEMHPKKRGLDGRLGPARGEPEGEKQRQFGQIS